MDDPGLRARVGDLTAANRLDQVEVRACCVTLAWHCIDLRGTARALLHANGGKEGTEMPLLLWLMGVPVGLIILLWLLGIAR